MKKVEIISIYNQKGGVGKTTTALQVADMLTELDFKVLMIDMDPQANLSRSLIPTYNPYKECNDSIYHLLLTEKTLNECARTVSDKLDIVVSSEKHEESNNDMLLSAAKKPPAIRLSEKISPSKIATQNEELLFEYNILQQKIDKAYDYIIIDCSPSKDLLSTVVLASADRVIIPVSNDKFAIDGITGVVRNINEVKKQYNKSLKIDGIFLNNGKNSKTYNELHALLLNKLPSYTLKHKVNNYVAVNQDTFNNTISQSEAKKQFRAIFKEVGYGMERK